MTLLCLPTNVCMAIQVSKCKQHDNLNTHFWTFSSWHSPQYQKLHVPLFSGDFILTSSFMLFCATNITWQRPLNFQQTLFIVCNKVWQKEVIKTFWSHFIRNLCVTMYEIRVYTRYPLLKLFHVAPACTCILRSELLT